MSKADIAILALLIVLITTSVFLYFQIGSEGTKCALDGLAYGARAFHKATGSSLSCSCITNSSQVLGFVFDETGNRTATNVPRYERSANMFK